jgi:thiol-disulfide isomerase/thioredoxin
MRKMLKYLVAIVLLVVAYFLLSHTYQSRQSKIAMTNRIQSLQHCSYESVNSGAIYIDEFNPGQPTVIIYFHPECEHCQYEASEIGKQPERFGKVNMIMITPDDSTKRVEAFAIKYRLWEVDNLAILLDRKSQFRDQFGASVIPSVFIYGSDKKLLKMYKGETKMDAIISSIKDSD